MLKLNKSKFSIFDFPFFRGCRTLIRLVSKERAEVLKE